MTRKKQQSVVDLERGEDKTQRHIWTAKIRRNAVIVATMAILFGIYAASAGWRTAEAGFFSFVTDMFTAGSNSSVANVQNAQILMATMAPFDGALGGGDITIVNKSALLSNTGPLGTIADIKDPTPSKDQVSIYVVRPGDTLSEIAKMFDVSVNTITWFNDIKRGDGISTGQTLVILPISGIQHTIARGDTVKSIAKKYDGDETEIIQFNGLPEDAHLAVGDTIIIPNGEAPATPAEKKRTSGASAIARGTSGPNYIGYYMRPIDGGIKTQGLHGYNGVDLATSCGSPVVASASGTVVISRSGAWNAGYGNYIVIQHSNNTQTLYSHQQLNIVRSGQEVVQGQVIGYVGSTGKSTGCHVHFEVRGARNPF